jgi:hypothetical protein
MLSLSGLSHSPGFRAHRDDQTGSSANNGSTGFEIAPEGFSMGERRTNRRPSTFSPDPFDYYEYEFSSQAFLTLRFRGYSGISFANLVRVAQTIETDATERHIRLTHRNLAAHRRQPCAFHWFDQNWFTIKEMYEYVLLTVLGPSEGVRREQLKASVSGLKMP